MHERATASEVDALRTLYKEMAGAHWYRKSGWLEDGTDHCTWHGVTCKHASVVGLDLTSNGVEGALPSALATLTLLRSLRLHGNSLNGTLPAQMCKSLTHLEELDLSKKNGLSGTLPPQLGMLTRLLRLDLSQNWVRGTIPSEVGRLSRLRVLKMDSNRLSGTLPAALQTIPHLSTLSFSSNWLSGTLPSTLSALTALTEFNLRNNQLSGSVPMQYENLTHLQRLQIEDNYVTKTSALKTDL